MNSLLDDEDNFVEKICSHEEVKWLQQARILVTDAYLLHQGVPSYPITRCSSFQNQMIEYVIAWIINEERDFMKVSYLKNKPDDWEKFRGIFSKTTRSLQDLTVTILGVGQIGSEIARALSYFGTKIHGYGRSTRHPDDVPLDAYSHGDGLKDAIGDCDYIISVMPSTSETQYILGGNVLQHAKKGCTLINLGRGDLISEEDIIKALDNEWIGCAILDVFHEEPLPQSSPLWHHPKVIVTPHIAAKPTAEDITRTFMKNYDLFVNKKPLLHRIDWDKGY